MKLRIAVFSYTRNFWGGSYQYARAFTEALADLGSDKYEVQVWHVEDEEWNTLCARLGFQEHILDKYFFPDFFLPIAQNIQNILANLDPNNIIGRNALLNSLNPYTGISDLYAWHPHLIIAPQMGDPAPYIGEAKHVGVIHDLMHRYETRFPEVGSEQEFQAREHLFKSIVAHCDTILVDSRTGYDQMRESYHEVKEDQLQILPLTAFPEITQCVPKQPNFPLPEKFFFYPAQFWLHKNHVGLAKAVALLKKECPDIYFVAAGNTSQNGYAPFMDIVTKEGLEKNFFMPGYLPVEELVWLYRHARALVMPTYFGPTNIPPMEAMALGCPVAISGIYGMPAQCGNAALYFKPNDPIDIAQVLRRLWTDNALCQELKEKGLQRSKLYDLTKFNKQVLRIIKKTCSNINLDQTKIEEVTQYPNFSLIIPTYNRAEMLHYTLDSMLAQDYPQDKFEIIVCNNNSSDDTQQVIQSYVSRYPNRIVPLFEKRQGVHYARNGAAYSASGDILYYTDDDMVADKKMLSEFARFFARHPKVGSATGKVRPLWEATPPEWVLRLCDNYLLSLIDAGLHEQSDPKDKWVFSCHQAMLRQAFFATHGFHPDFFAGELLGDGETGLNITIGKLGYHFGYTPFALTMHMIPQYRMTQEYLNKRLANQGNSDSYTEYREHHFSKEELLARQTLHSAYLVANTESYEKMLASGDIRWHLALAQVQYHLSRKKYEKRLIDDPSWREFVLKDDWLENAKDDVALQKKTF